MTITLLLILVVPLYFGIETIVDNAEADRGLVEVAGDARGPAAPCVARGDSGGRGEARARWQQIAATSPDEISAPSVALSPIQLVLWFVGQVGSIGLLLVQLLLTVIIAAILYANGETAARGADRFARRLAGPQGESMPCISPRRRFAASRWASSSRPLSSPVLPGSGWRSPACHSRRS